jgi:O-antigen/teichoic acid export membrane protein
VKLTASQDLAGDARRGVRQSFASSVVTSGLQILQIAILARLLTPHDFAVVAIATIVVNILGRFADFGLSGAIVHFHGIRDEELSTLYFINLVVGICLAGMVIASAPWAAAFYASPELTPVLHILASSVLLASLSGQFRALHQKRLDFQTLALASIASSTMSFVVAVGCALANMGVVSIAWGALAGAAASSAILIMRGLAIHRPRLAFDWTRSSRLIRFGIYQVGEQMLDFINMQLDSLLIGKFTGIAAVGYYSPIKSLCMKPIGLLNPIFTNVSFPIMSLVQNNLPRVAKIYLLQVRVIASITCPLYIFAAVAAEPLVEVIFGPQWLPAVPVMRALAVWGCLVSIGNPVGSLLLATGNVRRSMFWNVFASCITPASVIVAAPYGVLVVACAMVAVQTLLLVPAWRYLIWPIVRAPLKDYLKTLSHPAIPAAIAGTLTMATMDMNIIPFVNLLASGLVFALAYALLSLIFNRQVIMLLMQTAFHDKRKRDI